MLPVLSGGDFIIISKLYFRLKVGDFVVVDHPVYELIVKKVFKISVNKQYLLSGEDQSSLKPEQMGWLNKAQIKGKVICKIRK